MTHKKQALKNNNFTEAQLQIAWNRLKTHNQLSVNGEDKWIMLSPGTWNLEAGPDFLNAKFTKNGKTVTGDVEVHKRTTDWAMHGHHCDSRYDNVILHVIADDNSVDCSANIAKKLPNIPLILLKPRSRSVRIAPADKFPGGQCESLFSAMEDQQLERLFHRAGLKRFDEKVDLILDDMCLTGVNSAFLKRIFDACGYKKNRTQFAELFRRFSKYNDLSSIETEAMLWGESGLLPDPAVVELNQDMNIFVRNLWEIWWKIRKSAEPPIQWVRTGIRPMNSPERRIAALNVLIKKMGSEPLLLFAKFAKQNNYEKAFLKKVREILHCSHPLWDKYYSLTAESAKPSAILGDSRSADICVNTVLPSMKAYSILTGESEIGKFAEKAFQALPKNQSNRLLETAALKWFMPPARQKKIFTNAVTQQGAIHVYRNFCEEVCTECEICPLGELVMGEK